MRDFDFDAWVRSRPVMVVLYLASIVGLLIGIDTFLLHINLDPLGDSRAYYAAGQRLNAGLPLYDQPYPSGSQLYYWYPPLLAVFWRPLALLPEAWAQMLWFSILLAAFIVMVLRSGIRDRWTWIVLGWLAAPFVWALTVGQAHILVVVFLSLASPLGVALAAQLKVFPLLAGVYWLSRREWRALRSLIAWSVGFLALSFVLAPQATIDYIGFLTLDDVGTNIRNLSPFAISPILWVVSVIALGVIAWRTAHTKWGWTWALAFSTFFSPRLLMYHTSSMFAARFTPESEKADDRD